MRGKTEKQVDEGIFDIDAYRSTVLLRINDGDVEHDDETTAADATELILSQA